MPFPTPRPALTRRALALAGLAAFALGAQAQPARVGNFPAQPIRLVVPFPPGGATDTIGRAIAQEAGKHGLQVVVENRPGAAGNLGVGQVASGPADGYTIVLAGNNSVAVDPAQEKLPFVPNRDLVPVTPVVAIPYVVAANPAFPPNNIKELIEAAKKAPGTINFASSGTGAPPHMASELLLAMAGLNIKHIPYKGAVPAFTDVVGGQVQFITGDLNTARPFLETGRLKALATTGAQRLEQLPNVPTVAESGLPSYEAEGWFGLFAPSKTPPEILAFLSAAFEKARQEPEFRKRMGALGGRVMTMARPEFERYIASETTKRSNLIRTNKINLE
ncbi:MAG TPA: tripartite tricarboxylate transporter substrate binding protein [Ramlibacter sp.]|nr:tripartite tricarboxylate transporter substrate binding protein [Ramlibacter sp.]